MIVYPKKIVGTCGLYNDTTPTPLSGSVYQKSCSILPVDAQSWSVKSLDSTGKVILSIDSSVSSPAQFTIFQIYLSNTANFGFFRLNFELPDGTGGVDFLNSDTHNTPDGKLYIDYANGWTTTVTTKNKVRLSFGGGLVGVPFGWILYGCDKTVTQFPS